MPLNEVAVSMGIPYGTAKSRLHYALSTLRAGTVAEAVPATAQVRGGQLA